MENILAFIANHPIVSGMLASPIGAVAFFAAYKLLLKMLLSDKNIDKVADHIDKYVDSLQKRDKESGQATRSTLIRLAERIIKDLKDPSDGTN